VVIAPVVVLNTTPVRQVPTFATVALPDVPSVAGAPFTVSLAVTLAMAFDAMPASAVPLSGTALMDCACTGIAKAIAAARINPLIRERLIFVSPKSAVLFYRVPPFESGPIRVLTAAASVACDQLLAMRTIFDGRSQTIQCPE
jgi:hypothetical protein